VFKDVDSLSPGLPSEEIIRKTLPKCRVLPAVMGPQGLTIPDASGARRLDDPQDLVRQEIAMALQFGVRVIPLLVNDAPMPEADALREDIRGMMGNHAAVVRPDPDFHDDMDRLIRSLRDGAMTGFVTIEPQAPSAYAAAASAAYAPFKDSTDSAALLGFAESFPGTREGHDARERAAKLDGEAKAWKQLIWNDRASVQAFVEAWPQHPRVEGAKARMMELEALARANAEAAEQARIASAAQKARRQQEYEEALAPWTA
jgi:hypothetical protein